MQSATSKDRGERLPPEYLTRGEAAHYIGVASRTISDWQSRGIIPFLKLGRKCVRFRKADLDRAMGRFVIGAD